MNTEIRELMRLRDQTHRIAIKSKDVSYIRLYKCMRNRITSELRLAKKEHFHQMSLLHQKPSGPTFLK